MKKHKLTTFRRYLALEAKRALEGIRGKEATEQAALGASYSRFISTHRDLRGSLDTLQACANAIKRPPFSGDMGVGGSPAMPVRYRHQGSISRASANLMGALEAAYADLLLAFVPEKALAEISAMEGREAKGRHAHDLEAVLKQKYPEFYRLARKRAQMEKLKALLESTSGKQIESLTPDLHLVDDLGFDSLDIIEASTAIEEIYRIAIPLDEMDGMELSVGGLAKVLAGKLGL